MTPVTGEGSDRFLLMIMLPEPSSSPKVLPPPMYRDPGRDKTEEFSDLDCLQNSLFLDLESNKLSCWSPSIVLPVRFLSGMPD